MATRGWREEMRGQRFSGCACDPMKPRIVQQAIERSGQSKPDCLAIRYRASRAEGSEAGVRARDWEWGLSFFFADRPHGVRG